MFLGFSAILRSVETQIQNKKVAGKEITTRKQTERIISVATIQSALGNNFQIMGTLAVYPIG